MPTKRFGAKLIHAGEEAIVAYGKAGFDSTIVINIANQVNNDAHIYIAYVDSLTASDLSPEDYLVFNKTLIGFDQFSLKGVALEEGHSIIVRTDDADVSVIVYGIENNR